MVKVGGSIEVICGPMRAGKSKRLIRRLLAADRTRTQAFKSALDTRYDVNDITTHDGESLVAIPVGDSDALVSEIRSLDKMGLSPTTIGIDEVQFLDDGLIGVVRRLAREGRQVVLAGLDMTFEGLPFGPMGALAAIATKIAKVPGYCSRCGGEATMSWRDPAYGTDKVVIGSEMYRCFCFPCWAEVRMSEGH